MKKHLLTENYERIFNEKLQEDPFDREEYQHDTRGDDEYSVFSENGRVATDGHSYDNYVLDNKEDGSFTIHVDGTLIASGETDGGGTSLISHTADPKKLVDYIADLIWAKG